MSVNEPVSQSVTAFISFIIVLKCKILNSVGFEPLLLISFSGWNQKSRDAQTGQDHSVGDGQLLPSPGKIT